MNNTYSNYLIVTRLLVTRYSLGTLFFIIFINDLFDLMLIAKIICFADDTVILIPDKSYNAQ